MKRVRNLDSGFFNTLVSATADGLFAQSVVTVEVTTSGARRATMRTT
jgi:hypothetical protein